MAVDDEYITGSDLSKEAISDKHSSYIYEIPVYDRETLHQIEKLLAENGYKDIDQVTDHISCLEQLEQRIAAVVSQESSTRITDKDLLIYLERIRDRLHQLFKVRDRLK